MPARVRRSPAFVVLILMLAGSTGACGDGGLSNPEGAVGASSASPSPTSEEAPSGEPEIDREQVLAQVRATSPTTAQLRDMEPADQARALARCFRMETVRYCFGQGFGRGEEPDYQELARPERVESPTGDLTFTDWMKNRVALSDAQRLKVELEEAAAALDALPGVLRMFAMTEEVRRSNGR